VQFMAKAPWYLDSGGGPSLIHQKAPGKDYSPSPSGKIVDRYERGKAVSTPPAPTPIALTQSPLVQGAATKYRKGACTNCGAMTHSAKDCLERPRKLGARWTGRDIAPDEIIHDNRVDDWDSKRDRWDGYDPASHRRVVEEHEALEEARRKLREEQIDSTTDLKEVQRMAKAGKKKKKDDDDDDFGSEDESGEEDDLKYAEAADVVGQKLDAKTRVTVRNLRIREDTAKYLVNLDPERQVLVPPPFWTAAELV
jgi:pre-mRNA-processing factor SLU7